METCNNIIIALTLMDRMQSSLHARDRAPIEARQLKQIQFKLVKILELIQGTVRSSLIITSIGEVIELINTLLAEPGFVETSAEAKDIICTKISTATVNLYLFAGKFYEKHEFDYNIGLDNILRNIVDINLDNGYYFDVEVTQ